MVVEARARTDQALRGVAIPPHAGRQGPEIVHDGWSVAEIRLDDAAAVRRRFDRMSRSPTFDDEQPRVSADELTRRLRPGGAFPSWR